SNVQGNQAGNGDNRRLTHPGMGVLEHRKYLGNTREAQNLRERVHRVGSKPEFLMLEKGQDGRDLIDGPKHSERLESTDLNAPTFILEEPYDPWCGVSYPPVA